MNIERLTAVRDHIEAQPESFDMLDFFTPTDCGTAACIAGHAILMFGDEQSPGAFSTQAQALLDLTSYQGEELFFADHSNTLLSTITPTMAVATIDHLISTGEVKWAL